MIAIVVAGFWASYFGPMLRGNIARPWIIQLHGVVYVGLAGMPEARRSTRPDGD